MISETTLSLILLGILFYYVFTRPKTNLPPSPKGLPIIGNLHQMSSKMYKTMGNFSKECGSRMYTMDLVFMKFVVISDPKLLKEIFTKDPVIIGRTDMTAFDIFEGNQVHGLINSEGDYWEQLRRFTLRQLRDFGFGKQSMETCIMDEVKELHDWIRSQNGKPIPAFKTRLTIAALNSLWSIICGTRYSHDNPKLLHISKTLEAAINGLSESAAALLFAPWISKNIFPKWSGYAGIRAAMEQMRNFCTEPVLEHKKTYRDDFSRDFIDVFLKEIKETTDVNSAFYKDLGERQLIACVGDLFAAGSDTSSTTLTWAVLYLCTFPEKQKKLQKEIKDITGNSRPVSLTDRPNMPFAEAVLAEVLRCSSMVPGGSPRRAIADTEFEGYSLPKGILVFPDLYYIHHNPEIWGDPENFRPERFITPEGTFKRHEALTPFSIGRRQCLGEALARDTLFLFLNNTLQNFNIKFNPDKPHPDLEPATFVVLNPKPFEIIMEDRFALEE